jgi:tungstate transport system substrate-binding protein
MRVTTQNPTPLMLPHTILLIWTLVLIFFGCRTSQTGDESESRVLRLATTTSARDSGLLEVLLPTFEQSFNCRVDVIAVGTGAALQLGKSGDADAVLVHAREAELAFMNAGYGIRHEEFMKNEFVILGPREDPANVQGFAAGQVLEIMAEGKHPFISRGDQSGTHQREEQLWDSVGRKPDWEKYSESGQGMGATLTMANELNAYVLCDLGTYINFQDAVDLVRINGPSDGLENPYSCMVVSPVKHPHTEAELANDFADYLISKPVQERIANYRIRGTVLFKPTRMTDSSRTQP